MPRCFLIKHEYLFCQVDSLDYLYWMNVICSAAVAAVYVAMVEEKANAMPVEKFIPSLVKKSVPITICEVAGIVNASIGGSAADGVVAVL